MKKKMELTRSIGFQVFLYFVLAVSFAAGGVSLFGFIELWSRGAYQSSFREYQKEALRAEAESHLYYICNDREYFADIESIIQGFQRESEKNNICYEIVKFRTAEVQWSNASEEVKNSPFAYKAYFFRDTHYNRETRKMEDEEYMVMLYVDTEFSKEDELREIYWVNAQIFRMRWWFVGAGIAGIVLFIISSVWLLCNAGHRRGREGITPGCLSGIYLDILTAVFGAGGLILAAFMLYLMEEVSRYEAVMLILVLGGALEVVWCTIYLREFALRMKLGNVWRHSLIYVVLRFCWRLAGKSMKLVWRALCGIPGIFHVFCAVCLITMGEALGILLWGEAELFAIWFVEKLMLIPVVLYCALAFRKLCRGAGELTQGNPGYKLDTKYLILDFKEHGENLNRIGEGIAKAVEQRMQSERLKTELITNVSHDIKTPLTSIINYADLLGSLAQRQESPGEALDGQDRDGQMAEYSEVLLRQSKRLKKLLDDLVDASKATTGNLEVNLQPCVIGVLLSQALGEYESKLAEQNLTLHVSQPEEEIHILADGRHLWRVFDNLMNNICKYAQEGSRVYINVEREGSRAAIIFRNMSKYELNISAEELEERFVRGDASRHMEGSGLGLSIARSLVELQRGSMKIVTDGDLFKVTLEFEIL